MGHYELNVATPDNRHYCRIELGATMERAAKEQARAIALKFGPEYRCELTCWTTSGCVVDFNQTPYSEQPRRQ